MKDSNRRKLARCPASTHLSTLTIALGLALAFLAITTFNVYASPLAHNNAMSMNALARGGGGGAHGGSSGGHAGASDAGGHSLGSDTTTLHNSTEEENNTHNSNNNYNGHRNFIPINRSSNQSDISISQIIWSILIVLAVMAFIFYLRRRRAQIRL